LGAALAKKAAAKPAQNGIAYWIARVLAECEKVREGFDADPVHDLRVALRRCRSMADGFRSVDGDPTWTGMRRAGKVVFAALGDLRDTQVLLGWTEQLQPACPPVADRLKSYCRQREAELKTSAAEAVEAFDTRRWGQRAAKLDGRVKAVGSPTEVFQVLALERYEAARELHRKALRNRGKTAWHELRIGIKKFRYIVENFLPEEHRAWGADLKHIQDALGEVHDMDVLWDTACQIHAFASPQERQHWLAAVSRERNLRLQAYREKMVGRGSLWYEWRSGLPAGERLHRAVLKRFETWAASLDADPTDTQTLARLSLELFDAMQTAGLMPARIAEAVPPRDLLQVAALTLGAGGRPCDRGRHKVSSRLLRKLEVPPGWSQTDLVIASLVVRYHRGALPSTQKTYAALSSEDRHLVGCLGGILHLAERLKAAGEVPGV